MRGDDGSLGGSGGQSDPHSEVIRQVRPYLETVQWDGSLGVQDAVDPVRL